MTPLEAWHIISANLNDHYKARRAMHPTSKGYTEAEIEAEVICFKALQEMDERVSKEKKFNDKVDFYEKGIDLK